MSEIELERRAGRIKLLLMDCDGVLTDGRITLLDDGDELKSFHTRDGHGLVLLHRAGLRSGIISGRTAKAVERRARDLGVSFVYQGILDKIATFNELTNNEALASLSGCGAMVAHQLPKLRVASSSLVARSKISIYTI